VAITAGLDGALWFTDNHDNKIGRITTAGTITEFPLPTANSSPAGITAGPDGALWFTERGKIGRITMAGAITEFPLPTANSRPETIITGPDGALWFTGIYEQLRRITTDGVITEFPTTSGGYGIAVGPDGNLWFTEFFANQIGRLRTAEAQATIALNGTVFHLGQTLTYEATLTSSGSRMVDVYVGCLLPDGVTFLSAVQLAPNVISIVSGPSPHPLVTNVPLTSGTVSAVHLFNGTEPVGTYYTYAALVVAGSNPFVPTNQLALAVQPFQFSP
jgi:hypothetical protein